MTVLSTVLHCDGTLGCDCIEQRRLMNKNKRRKINIVHGTRNGYQRHLREKELPCEPCARANADYFADYHKERGRGTA